MSPSPAFVQSVARRVLIAVVVICVVAGTLYETWLLIETSRDYQQRADVHAREAAVHEANRSSLAPPWSDDEARLAEYHSRMNLKWEYAASHPWTGVEADPPKPK